ncbi:Allantoinase [Actinokineospora sp. UTMC 2448]|nr:Allantoinase [Actinokineospora sp. UTMC 2448]
MTLIRARRCVTPAGEVPAAVRVRAGRIAAVEPFDADAGADDVVDLADDEVLLPGLVDTHVHVNDPGRAEWEGFPTATRAAAAGGVTTLIDMPLNSLPPTTDARALEIKRAAARGRCHVDVGFWGGAVPGNARELPALHRAGVFGFKCFLLDSGVAEFGCLRPAELEEHLAVIADLDSTMLCHAEDGAVIGRARGRDYPGFLASRPAEAETNAVELVIAAARRTSARAHVVHLSAAGSLPLLAAAQASGVRVTAETCPHYLVFHADDIPDGATAFKCCPPIRDAANRDALWQGLLDGTISMVVSDHSPCTPELKRPDFGAAWGGIAGLQVGLSAVWTAAHARGIPLTTVVRWMATAPAEFVGLRRKGRIAEGCDADLVAFAPDEESVVDARTLLHRNPVSAYHGLRLRGVVRTTWLRGEPAAERPRGELLERGTA